MLYILYVLIFILIYSAAGYGVTYAVMPADKRRYVLVFAPWVGIGYVSFVSYSLYRLGIGGVHAYAAYLWLLPALFALYAVFGIVQNKDSVLKQLYPFIYILPLFAFCAFGYAGVSDFLTSISIGNNDIADYALVSQYLKEFSRNSAFGFFGQQDGIRFLADANWVAPNVMMAFVSSLLPVKVYEIATVATDAAALLTVPVFYAMCSELVGEKRSGVAMMTLVYSLNPMLYYVRLQGFHGQLMGVGYIMLLFVVAFFVLKDAAYTENKYRYFALFSFVFEGFLLSYVVILPIALFFLMMWLLAGLFAGKDKTRFVTVTVLLLLSGCMVLVITPLRVASVIVTMTQVAAGGAGWHIPPVTMNEVFGAVGNDIDFQAATSPYEILFSVVMIAFVLYAFVWKKMNYDILPEVVYVAAFVIMYMIFSIRGIKETGFGGYQAFKYVVNFYPLLLCCYLSIGLVFAKKIGVSKYYYVDAVLLCLLIAATSADYARNVLMRNGILVLTKDLMQLEKINDNDTIKSINISGMGYWDEMWSPVLLYKKRLYFKSDLYLGRSSSPLIGEWTLRKNDLSKGDLFVYKPKGNDTQKNVVNGQYYLNAGREDGIYVTPGAGWWGYEGPDHRWTGSNGRSSEIVVENYGKDAVVDIKSSYGMDADDKVDVYINGSLATLVNSAGGFEIDNALIKKGRNTIDIVVQKEPVRRGVGDPRKLSVLFKTFVLLEK